MDRGPLSLIYSGTFLSGDSPFDFDQVKAQSHLGWELGTSGIVDLHVESGIDLTSSVLDPLTASFSWGSNVDWRSTVTYDLSSASLVEILIRMNWDSDVYRAGWSLPFDAAANRLEPLAFSLGTDTDSAELALSGTLAHMALVTLDGKVSLHGASGWGVTLSTSFDADAPLQLTDTHYGVFRDIGDCLRIGVERGGGEIWIYGSILAFPEAVLRYAPESVRIQFGD
jgi:hypothetical protein